MRILLFIFLLSSCSLNRPSRHELENFQSNYSFSLMSSENKARFVIIKPYGGYGPPRGDTHVFNLLNNNSKPFEVTLHQGDYVFFDLCPNEYKVNYSFMNGGSKVDEDDYLTKLNAEPSKVKYYLFWGELIEIDRLESAWWLTKLTGDSTFEYFTEKIEQLQTCN